MTVSLNLRIKEIGRRPGLNPGFYWTLDDGPEDECFWSGPHLSPDAAKTAAIESLAAGYAAAAETLLKG